MKNKKSVHVWIPTDADYMSILRIGYKSLDPINKIIHMLENYVITWDIVKYLVDEIECDYLKEHKLSIMKDIDEEIGLFMDEIKNVEGNHAIESVNFRIRFALFGTRITHLWYDPDKSDLCLHDSGRICSYIGINKPVISTVER